MLSKYIQAKKTPRQTIRSFLYFLLSQWSAAVGLLAFIFLACFTGLDLSNERLVEINNAVLTAASILSAILITFLVGKVIQLREEKLNNWNEYHTLTQKIHNFRAALMPLYQSWKFWPDGLKYTMENKYASLQYYGVRKSIYMDATELSPLEREYVDNEEGLKNLYLQLRCLLPKGIVDGTLYAEEFDVASYYETSQLELWSEFECGSGFSYYFTNEYLPHLSFSAISAADQKKVGEHSLKIDADRYRNVPFGEYLYQLLGQQFLEDLLPRLFRLSMLITSPLSGPVKLLGWILPFMIIVGIIVPFLILLRWLPLHNSIFAAAAIVSLLFYLSLTIYQTTVEETKILHKFNR